MDFETIFISTISVVICVLPFMLMARNRKKREQQYLQELRTMAGCYQSKISHHEICGNIVLGIDESSATLFFIKKMQKSEEVKCVRLTDYRHCEVIYTRQEKNNLNETIMKKLELKFVPKNLIDNEVVLPFFNYEETHRLCGELQFIEAWLKIANEQINKQVRIEVES